MNLNIRHELKPQPYILTSYLWQHHLNIRIATNQHANPLKTCHKVYHNISHHRTIFISFLFLCFSEHRNKNVSPIIKQYRLKLIHITIFIPETKHFYCFYAIFQVYYATNIAYFLHNYYIKAIIFYLNIE